MLLNHVRKAEVSMGNESATHKLKSVKLWLTVGLIAFTGILTYLGSISGREYIDFIKWALTAYFAANVGTKATDRLKGKE